MKVPQLMPRMEATCLEVSWRLVPPITTIVTSPPRLSITTKEATVSLARRWLEEKVFYKSLPDLDAEDDYEVDRLFAEAALVPGLRRPFLPQDGCQVHIGVCKNR